MNRRYGIYYQGILMEEHETPAAAYKALIERTKSMQVFHELKVIEEESICAIS